MEREKEAWKQQEDEEGRGRVGVDKEANEVNPKRDEKEGRKRQSNGTKSVTKGKGVESRS